MVDGEKFCQWHGSPRRFCWRGPVTLLLLFAGVNSRHGGDLAPFDPLPPNVTSQIRLARKALERQQRREDDMVAMELIEKLFND